MPGVLFINCLPQDQARFEPLRLRLQQAGIPFYLPPPVTSPQIQQEVVETIQQTAISGGGMVCLLSRAALADPAYISNIQWMCENARSRKALIFYPLERLEDTRPIRLFAPQAYQITPRRRPETDLRRLTRAIHAVINPRPAGLSGLLSTQFSARLLRSLFIAALVVGIGAAAAYTSMKAKPTGPVPPTPTPVVMLVPFSGQSAPAGLEVDPGKPPEFVPDVAPEKAAPFAFQPAVSLDRHTFRDITLDGDYDRRAWLVYDNRLEGQTGVYVRQRDGVLNVQLAPEPSRQATSILYTTHLFNLQELSYLGIRFRLNPYQGSVRDGTFGSGQIVFQTIDTPDFKLLGWNVLDQDTQSNLLETSWHVLELQRLPSLVQTEVYLDGKKIDSLDFTQAGSWRWMRLGISMYISNTDEWTGMQVDEVLLGADEPISSRLEASGAPFHFTPEAVLLHQDFNAPLPVENIQAGAGFVSHAPGTATLRLPVGEEKTGVMLRFPTRPINEANYYATRFRFSSEEGNPWNSWSSFHIKIGDGNKSWDDKFDISFGYFPSSDTFGVSFGIMNGLAQFPFDFAGRPVWHTLEMVIQPPLVVGGRYVGWFWADGGLIGWRELNADPSRMLDPQTAYILNMNLASEGSRQTPFSLELDDLVIGTLPPEMISE
jgi:hypothetical protein